MERAEEPIDRPARQGQPPPETGQPLAGKPVQEDEGQAASRQERREERRLSERRRMAKHGASLRRIYRDAVGKRAAAGRKKGRKP